MADGIVVTDAGEVVIEGKLPGGDGSLVLDAVRVDTADTNVDCCIKYYKQARDCATGELVDVWLELTFDMAATPPRLRIDGGTAGLFDCPLYFKLPGDDHRYYIDCDEAQCTHGTLYSDIEKTYPWCGTCIFCPDDTPQSYAVQIGDLHLEPKVRLSINVPATSVDTPANVDEIDFGSDLTVVSDPVCLCHDGVCGWRTYIPDAVGATYTKWQLNFGETEWSSVITSNTRWGVLYTLQRDIAGDLSGRFTFTVALVLEQVDGGAPSDPPFPSTAIVFTAVVLVENCDDLTSALNCLQCNQRHDSDSNYPPSPPPPSGVAEWLLYRVNLYPADHPFADEPACYACGELGPISFPQLSWGGTAQFTASGSYCSFTPTYSGTISGAVPHCSDIQDHSKGSVGLNGSLGTDLSPDIANLTVALLDHFTSYTGAGCTGTPTTGRGDHHELFAQSVAASVSAGTLSTVEVDTVDGINVFRSWGGKATRYGAPVCGYPSFITYTFDPTQGGTFPGLTDDDYLYNGGTLTLVLVNSP